MYVCALLKTEGDGKLNRGNDASHFGCESGLMMNILLSPLPDDNINACSTIYSLKGSKLDINWEVKAEPAV